MADNAAMDPAAAKAAANAFSQFVTEDFTLFAVGVAVTITRTFARVKHVGFKGLQGDDYLVWLAAVIYAAETVLAYSVGNVAKGLANNGMTDEQRMALDPTNPEFQTRVIGCKIQLAGWSAYSALLWTLKASLLVFYIRLTAGLGRGYLRRIYIGFGILASSYIAATLNLFLGCRPFHRNWQISPDPGNGCQPAISTRVVWVYASLNVLSDLYLLSIPIPMLWNSSLKLPKKIGLIVLFSGGVFIIVCALIRAVLIVTDPIGGAQTAGSWAVRETFVAVLTTNLPMIYPLVASSVKPLFNSLKRSFGSSSYERSTDGKFKRSIITWGSGENRKAQGPRTANPIPGLTATDSEERILSQGQFKLQELPKTSSPEDTTDQQNSSWKNEGIWKDVEVAVTSGPSDAKHVSQGNFAFAAGPMRKSTRVLK